MFIEFDGILVNVDLMKEISLGSISEQKASSRAYVGGYKISMCVYNSDEFDYMWFFTKDEKELAEKEFNKIKERLLGKDNS